MGSVGNQNPWPPYNTFRDCTQGICSIYCPQWCYIIFPPPPPFALGEDDGDSGTDFSPLIIAVIGILASAFILVSYYTIISKYCRRRNDERIDARDENSDQNNDSWQNNGNTVTGGLDESLIKSITVCKFMKNDGFVESSDCSVCLSQFQENESLRLLPKCNHAFHISCIDTWLKSHASCPLCRAHIVSTHIMPEQPPAVGPQQRSVAQLENGYVRPISDTSVMEYQFRMQNGIHVIQDLEMGIVEEVVEQEYEDQENIEQKITRIQENGSTDLQMRRSISLNSSSLVRQCDRISIAEILQVNEDYSDGGDDDDENYQMRDLVKNNNNKIGILNLVRSPLAMRRSRSYVFTRYEKGKSSSINIPN